MAVYGGAFDPVTLAHVAVATVVHRHTGLSVWMMPCHGHRFGKSLTADAHRLAMVRLVALRNPWLVPSDWETGRQHDGSTFDTLSSIVAARPEVSPLLVMGLDNANAIDRWHRGRELVETFPCVVVGRDGGTPADDWFLRPPHVYIHCAINLHATQVREAVRDGKYHWAQRQLNAEVWDYVREHRLYGYKEE